MSLKRRKSVVRGAKGDEKSARIRRSGSSCMTRLPVHWPVDVVFLDAHSVPSDKLPERLHAEMCTEPGPSTSANPSHIRSQGWTVVRSITKRSAFVPAYGSELTHHPALGQYGLFAQRAIPPRTLVVPYLGLVHLAGDEDGDEDPESQYDAAIQASDGTRLGIDATKMGSEARFVNDYRGILIRPNLFFDEWIEEMPSQQELQECGASTDRQSKTIKGLALYTGAHQVPAGTELCVSYGKGWWKARS